MTKVKKETKVVKSPAQKLIKKKKPLKKQLNTKQKTQIIKTVKKEANKNKDTNTAVNYESLNIDVEQVQRGVEALLQYTEKHKSKDLFKGQQQIFVQITCIRIPSGANRKFRLKLKHPLITIDNEICLIVPDLQRGRNVDHEETIEHYENLLREKNVTYIKRIIPVRQLRVEYDQYELKRRLCGYYDYFLVDGRVSGHVLHLLGKTFNEKRKQPVPIQLKCDNLNNVILKALSKTELNVHSKGDTYIVQIGNTDMPVEHIVDNLKVIINSLRTNFPGKWKNIRALHVKTDKSIAIPVYYTLKNPNEVSAPTVKRPKLGETVTDEISTRPHTVTVHPDGRVVLNDPKHKNKKKEARRTPRKNRKRTVKKTQVNGKSPNGNIKRKAKSPVKVKKETKTPVKVKQENKAAIKVKKESPKKIKIEKQ